MKRIKVYLFFVLFFCFASTVRAATNTVDYSSQLSNIYSVLNIIAQDQQYISELVLVIGQFLESDIVEDLSDTTANVSHLKDLVQSIKNRCEEFKPLLQQSLSDLDTIISYLSSASDHISNIDFNTQSIYYYTSFISDQLVSIYDHLNDLSDISTSAEQIREQIQGIIDKGDLNKEETQQAILNVLTGITDTADSIKEALDIIQSEDGIADITAAIAALKNEVTQIYRILQTWDNNFFRYLYDRTFPNPAFEFYHISGSPFFENGYLTFSQQIGPLSSFSFVDWLSSALISHIEGLHVINDNLLFIAKVLATNAQEQAMAEFEEEANDTVSTIQSQYTELINSSSYTPKQFDLSKTHLNDVRSFFGGLSGQNSYDSVKVHNLDFTSLEAFGFPTHIEYRYDISESSTFWEVCRAFFTCLWVFLFASVFFMVVRTFYHFYHICFNALAGNRSQGYEVSSVPLHW